jgi:hypothetical protein
MSKALVLGAAVLAFSAAGAGVTWADGAADLPPPAEGYAAPAVPPVYSAPPVYAVPVYTAPQVYVVPAPIYAAPVVSAPVVSRPIYAYAPGYWGGYGHGWRGYGHGYGHRYVGWR